MTDNERFEREGVEEQAEAQAQETVGKGKRRVEEAIENVGPRIKR